MWPGPNAREEDDTSKGPESPVTVEIPSRQRQSSESVGNHTTESSVSPKSATHESQDRNHKPGLWASNVHNGFVPVHGHDGVSSWNASSDKQLGSPGSATDRVFPIRSVVSVDSSQTPYTFPARNSSEQQEYFPSGVVHPSNSGHDIAGDLQSRRGHGQSFSEADGRPVLASRRQQHPSRLSGERVGGDRKASTSTGHRDSDRYGGGIRMHLFSDATSEKSNERTDSVGGHGTINSNSLGTHTPMDQESISGLVTARFKHIVTAEGHAVITGRDGETLQRCEDEP
jgi:hypothetical protein